VIQRNALVEIVLPLGFSWGARAGTFGAVNYFAARWKQSDVTGGRRDVSVARP